MQYREKPFDPTIYPAGDVSRIVVHRLAEDEFVRDPLEPGCLIDGIILGPGLVWFQVRDRKVTYVELEGHMIKALYSDLERTDRVA